MEEDVLVSGDWPHFVVHVGFKFIANGSQLCHERNNFVEGVVSSLLSSEGGRAVAKVDLVVGLGEFVGKVHALGDEFVDNFRAVSVSS
jgi:hypothetical protein